MIDRDALAREMLEAWKIDKGLPCEKAADIAIRHIANARAEALEEAATRIMPKNKPSDWSEYAKIRADAAESIRALMEPPA
jgi:hypothetical protein